MTLDSTQRKQQAVDAAVALIESGMIVGLGHGSTALLAVRRLAERLRSGDLHNIQGIPCSQEIATEARRLNIPLTTFDEHPTIDLTVDGADEVDTNLNLIKGGGGALLREKIVAQASRREIIMIDESKMSPVLGTRWAVPVEIIPFGWRTQAEFLESLGAAVSVRKNSDGEILQTEQGNMILDGNFGAIADLNSLDQKLTARIGIVEHGLFLGLATEVVVAGPDGVRILKRKTQKN